MVDGVNIHVYLLEDAGVDQVGHNWNLNAMGNAGTKRIPNRERKEREKASEKASEKERVKEFKEL